MYVLNKMQQPSIHTQNHAASTENGASTIKLENQKYKYFVYEVSVPVVSKLARSSKGVVFFIWELLAISNVILGTAGPPPRKKICKLERSTSGKFFICCF